MKTKRLFLKLVLAVCFLMAVPPREAEAAPVRLNIEDGDILVEGDKLYIGSDPSKKEYELNSNTFTIYGTAYNPTTITINKNVTLTFEDLKASPELQLIINDNVNATINVSGTENRLASSKESAVKIANGASLHFTSSSTKNIISINGRTTLDSADGGSNTGTTVAAVAGGGLHIEGAHVILNAGQGEQDIPFKGSFIALKSGILECYKNGKYTSLGTGRLDQSGGTIIADGLARVDTEREVITGLNNPDNCSITRKGTQTPLTKNKIGNDIVIPNEWHGWEITIIDNSTTGGSVTGSSTTSSSQNLTIPTRRATPQGWDVQDESTSGKNDGAITNVNDTIDYQKEGESSWTRSSGTEITGLAPGNYYLRNSWTSDQFASLAIDTPIEIKRGGTLEVTKPTSFGSQPYGYEPQTPKGIVLKNLDNTTGGDITINDITVSNNNFVVSGPRGRTLQSGQIDRTSWTIKPADKLNASDKAYTADITVHYTNRDGTDLELEVKDVVDFTVTKLPYPENVAPPAPDATKVKKITFESIELEPIPADENTGSKAEYGIYDATEIKWQDSPVFTGLDSEKEYQFVARYADSNNYEASKRSDLSDKVKTEKKASIIYSSKELSLIPGREYLISVSGSGDSDKCKSDKTNGNIDIKDKWFGKTIILSDELKGTTQELAIPDIGKAPTSPKGQAESFSSAGDGKILGVTTSMEYKLKGSNDDWITCPAKTIENLAAGTYLVRTKAVDEGSGENKKYTFASQATEVVVGRGNALSITPETFDLGKSPYKVLPTAKAIAFRNHDKTEDITIKSIALSDDSPFAILHKETDSVIVPAGKNNETFKIQPKPDLNVGTYTDEFVVTFEVGYNPDTDTSTGDGQIQAQSEGFNTDSPDTSGEKSAAIPITFTVEKGTQEAPPVPAEKSVKSTSITLETIPNSTVSGAKAQYSKDSGKTWQDSPTFNKLKADTEYYFVSRYAATDNYNESDISAGENAITTAEKDDDDDTDNSNKNVSSNANGSNGTNGTSGTNGTNGTNGTTGTNTTGTNGTNGTNNTNGTTSRGVSAARTGDLNNIQLWVTLMIGSYLSCYLIIRDRIKKARIK